MKILRRLPLLILLLACLLLGLHLAWRLTGSATGFTYQAQAWVDAGVALLGIDDRTIGRQHPPRQAEFWLREIERIPETQSDSQIALGAAWMLDSPQLEYITLLLQQKPAEERFGLPQRMQYEINRELAAELEDEFEAACGKACAAQIDQAIALDPNNLDAWRAKAMFAFRPRTLVAEYEPRVPEWRTVLRECAKHDPDNALYDYLAALQLWETSAEVNLEFEQESEKYSIDIHDQQSFQEADAHFAAGAEKPFLKFGLNHHAATIAFLKHSSLPTGDHLNAAGSRSLFVRGQRLLFYLARQRRYRLWIDQQDGDHQAAAEHARAILRIVDQSTGQLVDLTLVEETVRKWALQELVRLSEDDPGMFSDQETEKLTAELEAVKLDLQVARAAMKVLKERSDGVQPQQKRFSGVTMNNNDSVAAWAYVISIQLAVVCGGAMLLMGVVAWATRKKDAPERTVSGGFAVPIWILSMAGGFFFLGMIPADLVSLLVLQVLFWAAVVLGYLLMIGLLLWAVRKLCPTSILYVAAFSILLGSLFFATFFQQSLREWLLLMFVKSHLVVLLLIPLLIVAGVIALGALLVTFFRQDLSWKRKASAWGLSILFGVLLGPGLLLVTDGLSEYAPQEPTLDYFAMAEASVFGEDPPSLPWILALVGWLRLHGSAVTALGALFLIAGGYVILQARGAEGGLRALLRSGKRRWLHRTTSMTARSAGWMGLGFLLIYLTTAPIVLPITDRYHTVHYARLEDPEYTKKEFDEAVVQVKADATLMAELKEKVRP